MSDTLKSFIAGNKDQLILFNLLSDEDLELILPYLEMEQCAQGSALFNEGDSGDYIGIIVSGKMDVKKQTEFKGGQLIIASLKKGSFVGEMSLVNENESRSATVEAAEDSELIILRRESLDALSEKYPTIGIKILKGLNRVLAVRLRKTVERLTSIF
jgi:CRP/FNR family cyclic AMP-dependent transcriptional regulator